MCEPSQVEELAPKGHTTTAACDATGDDIEDWRKEAEEGPDFDVGAFEG